MKFTSYNIEKLETILRDLRKDMCTLKCFIIFGLFLLILPIIVLLMNNRSFIHQGDNFVYIFISLFIGGIFVISYGADYIGCLARFTTYRRQLKKPPILELTDEAKVIYKDNKKQITLSNIKKYKMNLKKHTFNITGKTRGMKKTLKICLYTENLHLIRNIIDTFIAMEKAKQFSNPTFKTLIELHSHDLEELYNEIKSLPFLVPVNYHLDTNVIIGYSYIFDNKTGITFPTLSLDDGIYMCIYTNFDKIDKDSPFIQRMVFDFATISEMFVKNAGENIDLFNNKNALHGFIINPNDEHVVIQFNKI